MSYTINLDKKRNALIRNESLPRYFRDTAILRQFERPKRYGSYTIPDHMERVKLVNKFPST